MSCAKTIHLNPAGIAVVPQREWHAKDEDTVWEGEMELR